MPRPKQQLTRISGKVRDARLFVIATEDTFAPRQYFRFFDHERVVVTVLPSSDGCSNPASVVQKLTEYARDFQLGDEDQLWALIDTDHWIQPNHKKGLLDAINDARHRGFRVAMSNPCFDLWLLLHHEDIAKGTAFEDCKAVGTRIRELKGEFNKTNLKAEHYPAAQVIVAITRARAMESNPDEVAVDFWPEATGTRVYLLMQELKHAGLLRGTP